jgi:hypothetical protein
LIVRAAIGAVMLRGAGSAAELIDAAGRNDIAQTVLPTDRNGALVFEGIGETVVRITTLMAFAVAAEAATTFSIALARLRAGAPSTARERQATG